jgi:hypothetical protein
MQKSVAYQSLMGELLPFVQLDKWFLLMFDRKIELDSNRKKRKESW